MLKVNKNCNICNSSDLITLHYFHKNFYDSNKFFKHSWDGDLDLDLKIVKCKKCDLVFQNPCINHKALCYFYPENIIPNKINLKNQLNNHKFSFLINQIILKIYPENFKNVSVLDIGARYGILSSLLCEIGFNAISLEFNKKCVQTAIKSGVKYIHSGTVKDLSYLSKHYSITNFNIVILNDLIEHLINPKADLLKISNFQKKGDRIIISTPNFNSMGYKFFKKYWYYIHGQHTYYFTEKTIALLSDKTGYELELKYSIPFYKSFKIILPNIFKLFKHIYEIKFLTSKSKIWFANNRPYLFDSITLVLKKK